MGTQFRFRSSVRTYVPISAEHSTTFKNINTNLIAALKLTWKEKQNELGGILENFSKMPHEVKSPVRFNAKGVHDSSRKKIQTKKKEKMIY